MEPKVNVNIEFFPEGTYVFKGTLGPSEDVSPQEELLRPLYNFPTGTGPTHALIVYGLPFINL